MKQFDTGPVVIIGITFVLFALALFFTGFTHDLLLEAGVFLISIKLIMMAYKTSVGSNTIKRHLRKIEQILKQGCENEQGDK